MVRMSPEGSRHRGETRTTHHHGLFV